MNLFHRKNPNTVSVKPKSGGHWRIGRNPYTDWALIFILGSIMTSSLIVIGLFKYRSVDTSIADTSSTLPPHQEILDSALLQRLLIDLDARAVERRDLLQRYFGADDPAL